MKILNFGSLNIDHTYRVEKIAAPGQTVDSLSLSTSPGGKGLNQTLAVLRAGAAISHAGLIGEDGRMLKVLLEKEGADCSMIRICSTHTGSAFIQVENSGENCIVLYGGANRSVDEAFCDEVLDKFGRGDVILLQNEISSLDYIIRKAAQKGMYIVLNPSPVNEKLLECSLRDVSMFILNEEEGEMLTGSRVPGEILEKMISEYPGCRVVLTLGDKGVMYRDGKRQLERNAFRVNAVDTTAAGDTFTGYFLAAMAECRTEEEALERACAAAAVAVTGKGAADSIPQREKVEEFLLRTGCGGK